MARVTLYFTAFTLMLVALHAWAALAPSHYNWGLHTFGFLPAVWGFSALAASLLILVPGVRQSLFRGLSTILGAIGRRRLLAGMALTLAVWGGILFLFPQKFHLLGDSALILELTPRLPAVEDASANFRNQPLTYHLLRLIQWGAGGGGAVEAATLYGIAGGVAGIAYLALIAWLLKSLALQPLDALLIGVILLFRMGVQFFLGYVENYMFYYVAITGYVIAGWLALEGKCARWLPITFLAAVPMLHYAGAVFLPTGLVLAYAWRGSRGRLIVAGLAALALGAAAWELAFGPTTLTVRVADALRHDLLPLATPAGGVPYGILSAAHLVDWLNSLLHAAPFAVACMGVAAALLPPSAYRAAPAFRFLAVTSAAGLAASFVILPGLGMARDWDMFSNFFIPLRLLSVYLLVLLLRERATRHVLAIVAVVGLMRWGGWMGLNASSSGHLARAEVLTVPELSGTFPKIYYEHLAKTFFRRNEYARAAAWYERYMEVDSANPRILANLSDCYRALGDGENIFRLLRRSVDASSTNPGVYSNLAVEYIRRGDTTRAVELLNEALRHDPFHTLTHGNLGLIAAERGEYRAAQRHSLEAIRLGMREPSLFKSAAFATYFLGEHRAALPIFEEYLRLSPTDREARSVLEDLRRRILPGRGAPGAPPRAAAGRDSAGP